jgi:hypothetical protein
MSARNLEKAKEYTNEILRERQIAFYNYVRKSTQDWLNAQKEVGPTRNRTLIDE